MTCRKWLVRGLVFTVVAGLGLAGWLYYRFTNPAAVRRQVLAKVGEYFVGAEVSVESARLRLFGGIAVTDLRMARRDDPDRVDFAHIPSAVIYHDKEQLLDGKLAIRKIDLYRPRIHVHRRRDGTWNLAGVLGTVDPNRPIPTIIIHQGTVLIEDDVAAPSAAPLEITDFNVTLLNDPVQVLNFTGTGQSDLAGVLEIEGKWQRATAEVTVSLDVPAAPVGPRLVQRLGAYSPKLAEHARQLEGAGKLHADLRYSPRAPRAWSHDLRWQLTGGKLSHPLLPVALEQLEIRANYLDGLLTLERFTAASGPARVELTGWARNRDADTSPARPPGSMEPVTPEPQSLVPADTDFKGHLKIEDLPLSAELFARLPAAAQDIQARFAPVGPIDVDFRFECLGGKWSRQCTVKPEDVTVTFAKFPYPLRNTRGTLEFQCDPARDYSELRVDLVGRAGTQPVYVKGTMAGAGPYPQVGFTVWGDDLFLDEPLLAALPEALQPLARSFHASGRCNFLTQVHRDEGSPEFTNRHEVHFHHAALRFNVFPYPLENVSGTLAILPDHWEARDFRGTHKGGEVRVSARSNPTAAGDQMTVEVAGTDLLLDEELEGALLPKLKPAWEAFSPAGRMSFTARVDRLPNQPQDLDATVTVRGCTLKPKFFPCQLTDVSGTVRYAQDVVHVKDFKSRHGDSAFSLKEGKVYLKPAGGYWAQLTDLTGSPLAPTPELIAAMPPALKKLCEAIRLKDPVALRTQLTIDAAGEPNLLPVVYWDGGLGVQDASLYVGAPLDHVTGQLFCIGRYNGRQLEGVVGNVMLDQITLFKQPFRNVHSQIEVPADAPQVLQFPNVKARLFGGDIGGEVRVEFGPTLRYFLNLTALQVNLEEFGKQNLSGGKAQLSGQATARLYLSGQGAGLEGLEGRGTIDVETGKLYNLPVLLDLLKVLSVRLPDRTAFEEAHAAFSIHGRRVNVGKLDLYGSAISLSGQGEMNLDGSDVQMDFYAVWGRITQMLPPVLREIPPALSQNLLKIKMRGKVGDLRFNKEPVPVLVEPLEKLIKRMRDKDGDAGDKPAEPRKGFKFLPWSGRP